MSNAEARVAVQDGSGQTIGTGAVWNTDEWTNCPRCKEQDTAKQGQQYDDFLYENYRIGITGGVFLVSYRALCHRCGWTFEYEHEQQVKP